MKKNGKALREGYSTGACAAAATKACALKLVNPQENFTSVTLDFPDGISRTIPIEWVRLDSDKKAHACVVKDAGDDPDVTHGAEIISEVVVEDMTDPEDLSEVEVEIRGGKGVGVVTKPGLSVKVGQPAINPVPKRMIKDAATSVLKGHFKRALVTIIVPDGEELAKKTLNSRLGIVGGISILGTTGIVKPISEAAWCATISVSMDVAVAAGLDVICLSTGRSSEAAAVEYLGLKEEAYISMGDYVGFSLKEAAKRPFKKIIIACQWSKLMKMAMGWKQTHVRFGALDPKKAVEFLNEKFSIRIDPKDINTVRQMLSILMESKFDVIKGVCSLAQERLKALLPSDLKVEILLVSYDKKIIHEQKDQ